MGGFQIAGPVVTFTFDESSLVSSTQAALQKIQQSIQQSTKQNSQQIISQISNPLQEQAARLRALFSTGAIGLKDLQVEQKKLLGLQDQEINSLLKKDQLTKNELSTLKQITLERERQANAISRGTGVGVTSGTQSALGLVTGNITRDISQLGARLVGVSGGSGAETAILSGAAAGLTEITAAGGPAIAVLGGVAGAALAAAAAATSLAVSGGKIVENFTNISKITGISTRDLQVLDVLAQSTGSDLDSLVTGFKKFSQALTGGASGDPGIDGGGKKASDTLKILGVTSKDSFTALEQLAEAFKNLPDGATRATAATDIFGKSALTLIPYLSKGKEGVDQSRAIVEQYAGVITGKALKAQEDYKTSTIKLGEAFDSLKISATPLLDILSQLITSAADFLKIAETSPKDTAKGTFFGLLQGIANGGSIGTVTASIAGNLAGVKPSSATATGDSNPNNLLGINVDAITAKFGPTLDELKKEQSGQLEALRKLIAEGAKESAALNEEAGKSGLAKITEIGTQSSIAGLTPQDRVLAEQQQKLQAIADIMLNFPQFANQAQGAIIGLTKSTTDQLTALADAALKKAQDEGDKLTADEEKRQAEVTQIVRHSADRVTIARAEASGNASAKIIADEQKILDDAIAKASQRGATEQQLQQLIINANQAAADKIVNLQRERLKQTQDQIKSESGKLFDALVSGGGKNFATSIKNLLTSIALAPVKTVFESVATAIFTPVVTAAKNGLTSIGQGLKGQGGILGAIGASLAPDDKTILNTQITSLNTTATGANTDAITGLTGLLSGAGGTGAGTGQAVSSGGGLLNFGNIFGGSTSGSGGLIFNNQSGQFGSSGLDNLPFGDVIGRSGGNIGLSSGGSGGALGGLSSLGSIFKDVAPFIPGIIGLAGGGSATAKAGSGVSLLGAGLLKASGNSLGDLFKGNAGTLGKIGGGIAGVGSFVSGIAQGGLGGLLQTTLGGAEFGAAVGGPLGAAIGAGVGFVAGGIRALFGGPSKAQRIAKAITNQTVSSSIFSGNAFIGQEFDRSAQDSFTKTVGSTFSEGPGGVFSSGPINDAAPITVHYAPTIQAFDATGVNAVLAQHGTTIAQAISGKVSSSNSGIGRAVRTAAFPA